MASKGGGGGAGGLAAGGDGVRGVGFGGRNPEKGRETRRVKLQPLSLHVLSRRRKHSERRISITL